MLVSVRVSYMVYRDYLDYVGYVDNKDLWTTSKFGVSGPYGVSGAYGRRDCATITILSIARTCLCACVFVYDAHSVGLMCSYFLTLFQPELVGERAVSRGSARLAAQPAAHIAVQPAAQLAVQGSAMRRVRCKKKRKGREEKEIAYSIAIFSEI